MRTRQAARQAVENQVFGARAQLGRDVVECDGVDPRTELPRRTVWVHGELLVWCVRSRGHVFGLMPCIHLESRVGL